MDRDQVKEKTWIGRRNNLGNGMYTIRFAPNKSNAHTLVDIFNRVSINNCKTVYKEAQVVISQLTGAYRVIPRCLIESSYIYLSLITL